MQLEVETEKEREPWERVKLSVSAHQRAFEIAFRNSILKAMCTSPRIILKPIRAECPGARVLIQREPGYHKL
jgi:hypothetical protein